MKDAIPRMASPPFAENWTKYNGILILFSLQFGRSIFDARNFPDITILIGVNIAHDNIYSKAFVNFSKSISGISSLEFVIERSLLLSNLSPLLREYKIISMFCSSYLLNAPKFLIEFDVWKKYTIFQCLNETSEAQFNPYGNNLRNKHEKGLWQLQYTANLGHSGAVYLAQS